MNYADPCEGEIGDLKCPPIESSTVDNVAGGGGAKDMELLHTSQLKEVVEMSDLRGDDRKDLNDPFKKLSTVDEVGKSGDGDCGGGGGDDSSLQNHKEQENSKVLGVVKGDLNDLNDILQSYNLLKDKKNVTNPKALDELLQQMGVTDACNLMQLFDEDIIKIAHMLEKVPRNRFLELSASWGETSYMKSGRNSICRSGWFDSLSLSELELRWELLHNPLRQKPDGNK